MLLIHICDRYCGVLNNIKVTDPFYPAWFRSLIESIVRREKIFGDNCLKRKVKILRALIGNPNFTIVNNWTSINNLPLL